MAWQLVWLPSERLQLSCRGGSLGACYGAPERLRMFAGSGCFVWACGEFSGGVSVCSYWFRFISEIPSHRSTGRRVRLLPAGSLIGGRGGSWRLGPFVDLALWNEDALAASDVKVTIPSTTALALVDVHGAARFRVDATKHQAAIVYLHAPAPSPLRLARADLIRSAFSGCSGNCPHAKNALAVTRPS